MNSSRRRVLQLLGLSAVGLTAKPVLNAFAAEQQATQPQSILKPADNALTARHWAMVIDTREFESEDDVMPLVEACHTIHNVPQFTNINHEIKWIWAEHYHNAFPGKAAS